MKKTTKSRQTGSTYDTTLKPVYTIDLTIRKLCAKQQLNATHGCRKNCDKKSHILYNNEKERSLGKQEVHTT